MSVGLLALLDDVAAIAKAAAASLDDMGAMAVKAGAKSAGVVIDDAAVTPRYALGLDPARELPLVARIARGSLRNKLVFLLPVALALAAFAPWAITPLLTLGGGFLVYEGAVKAGEWFGLGGHGHGEVAGDAPLDPVAFENARAAGAIRTDFILSAEIMAIALASIPEAGFWARAVILAMVGAGITGFVYGAVALIVKADDIGLALAANARRGPLAGLGRRVGRGLVRGMPGFLAALAVVGTIAMLWVGGGIVLHGLESFGFAAPAERVHALAHAVGAAAPAAHAAVEWIAGAAGAAVFGLVLGVALAPIVDRVLVPALARLRG